MHPLDVSRLSQTFLECPDSFGVLVFSFYFFFWPRFGEQDGMKPSFFACENKYVKSHET